MRAPIHVEVGDRHPARDIGPLTQTDLVRFAGASGDFNPLHHDAAFAESSGFTGVIAMGQMQAGMLAGWLSDWLGVEHLREYDVRFLAPVFVGDVIRLAGEVVAVDRDGEETLARIELSASRGGETLVRATATVSVRPHG